VAFGESAFIQASKRSPWHEQVMGPKLELKAALIAG